MNHIKNVAIVGATGSVGTYIVAELIKTGKHNVTAISRSEGTKVPDCVSVKVVDYDDHSSLVNGLRGQDILIITMAITAPKDTQTKLISAAHAAGVQWIMPNEWGYSFDDAEDQFGKDIMLGPGIAQTRQYVKEMGLNFIGVNSGFWYEFSLSGGEGRYGFDFAARTLTLFDDGAAKIQTTTWTQTGQAVAKLLSLPISSGAANDAALSKWRDGTLYIESFQLSQKDMLASVLRVTGAEQSDWMIRHETAQERFNAASEKMGKGDFSAYVHKLYSRIFVQDGRADFSSKVQNGVLGLAKEDLDECTKRAVEMAAAGGDGKY